MTTRFDCTLDGTRLSSLDESICILDIREDAPKMRTSAVALSGGGQRLLSRERESLSVQVSFAIQEPDVLRRQELFRTVLAWAEGGGLLTISGRTGQQLQVICTAPPVLHAEDWTETLHITFATTQVPYWEDAELTLVPLHGAAAAALSTPGNAGTAPVTVLAINTGGEPVTRLTLACGDTQMVFNGLSIPAGGAFVLSQSEGALTAMVAGESVLKYRTADSDDLLLAPCGKECTVRADAGQPLTATFSVRGRYL